MHKKMSKRKLVLSVLFAFSSLCVRAQTIVNAAGLNMYILLCLIDYLFAYISVYLCMFRIILAATSYVLQFMCTLIVY